MKYPLAQAVSFTGPLKDSGTANSNSPLEPLTTLCSVVWIRTTAPGSAPSSSRTAPLIILSGLAAFAETWSHEHNAIPAKMKTPRTAIQFEHPEAEILAEA